MNDSQYDRLPPHNIEAEQSLLTCLCLAPKIHDEVRGTITRDAFFQTDHQIIWDVLVSMIQIGRSIDVLTLASELDKRQLLEEIGGRDYLRKILDALPSAAHWQHYAAIVHEKYVLRKMISAANDSIRRAYAPHVDAEEILRDSITDLVSVANDSSSIQVHHVGDLAQESYERLESDDPPLMSMGYAALDDRVGGIAPGENIIVAGRPSMGKSLFARDVCRRLAKRGIPVALVSLEESRQKIAQNLNAAECDIVNGKLRRKQLDTAEWKMLAEGLPRFSKMPFWVVDRAFTLDAIRSSVAVLVARHGVKLIALDYLQRVQAPGRTRFDQVTAVSLGISRMLKEMNISGIILAQLNRELLSRESKRPTIGDLRESGQIEQDADGILLLHREDYYHTSEEGYDPTHEAELIVAKWRDDARGGVVKLRSQLPFQRFDDIQPEFTI